MQKFVIELSEAKLACGFDGSQAEFKKSKDLIEYCIKNRKIVRVTSPSQLSHERFHDYHRHLLKLARAFVREYKIQTWTELETHSEMHKVAKILHEFGVRAELFAGEQEEELVDTGEVTLTQIWEVAKVHMGFKGSESSFKNWLQEKYGSLAEYCLAKGLPINATKWESNETAVRVAKKLGSLSEIRTRSRSLLKYLEAEKLLEELNLPESSAEHLIVQLVKTIWNDSETQNLVIAKWCIGEAVTQAVSEAESANISLIASQLVNNLTAEELGLLYYDIVLVFDQNNEPSDFEKKVTAALDKSWRAVMYPYAEQAMRFRRSPFVPHSIVSAIGYILFQAVSVDGHIHVDELLALKNCLTKWNNVSVRKILAAVNFCLHGSRDGSILGLEQILKIQTKSRQSVINCCALLISNGESDLGHILLEQIKVIAAADSVVHSNEKWLIEIVSKELSHSQKAG